MMVQLIYTSRLIFDTDTPHGWSRVEHIVAQARERNNRVGITGFLIVGKDWVVQILEGEKDVVNRTFQRILSDPRHRNASLIDMRVISARNFEGWSLGMSQRPRDEMPIELMSPSARGFNPLNFKSILAMAQVEAA